MGVTLFSLLKVLSNPILKELPAAAAGGIGHLLESSFILGIIYPPNLLTELGADAFSSLYPFQEGMTKLQKFRP